MTMAMDASKYDQLCARVRAETQASAVVLIVVGGPSGSGYSIQALETLTENSEFPREVPRLLREMADHLEGGNDVPTGRPH